MFATFYHTFDKPSAAEHTRAIIECEQGTLAIDGWFPTRLTVEGWLSPSAVDRARDLLPAAEIVPLPEPQSMLADGRRREITHRIRATVALGDKEEAYAAAVAEAMRDFAAWVGDAGHVPRVTGVDGRAALATALAATALAERNAA